VKPSVGRIVHYYPDFPQLAPRPAIVLDVTEYDDEDTGEHLEENRYYVLLLIHLANGDERKDAPFSVEPKVGHWSWPPRV